MQLNHESFEDLVGAYALDACDEHEIAAIEAYVADNPDAAVEVEQLRAAAAWLAATGPVLPPPSLRSALLGQATAIVPGTGVEAYSDITELLAREVEDLSPASLDAVTLNGLTVRELLVHLTAIDRVFLGEFTNEGPAGQFPDKETVVAITDDALAQVTNEPFSELFRTWNTTRRKLRDAASAAPERTVMGYSSGDALTIRAFETWTHLDDIRRAREQPGYAPSASVLRAMADLSMRLVPYALASTGRAHPGEAIKVVLTGPGGRSWSVPGAPGEVPADAPATVMTLDIVDWCHRFADRVEPEALAIQVDGDRNLAADLVAAAPAFASL